QSGKALRDRLVEDAIIKPVQQVLAVRLAVQKIANLALGRAPDRVAFDGTAALGGEIHLLTLLLARNFPCHIRDRRSRPGRARCLTYDETLTVCNTPP